ncbi:MAG: hypothetical protein WCY93_11415 [Anaerolineaceae bacterium]
MALLITEVFNEDCEVLTEATEDGKKNYYIEGIFMQAGLKNRNGRIYPVPILERELKRYDEQFIKTKRALGELGHPNGPQINGDRVCHLVTEMKQDGSNFYGKAKILGTPMGNIVKTFVDEGVRIGVSTRGMGSVNNKNGIMEVASDYHMACIDVVTDPSGPDCFVNGIMENTQYFYDIASGTWRAQELIEDTVKEIKQEYKATVRKTIDEAKAIRVFEKFVQNLRD